MPSLTYIPHPPAVNLARAVEVGADPLAVDDGDANYVEFTSDPSVNQSGATYQLPAIAIPAGLGATDLTVEATLVARGVEAPADIAAVLILGAGFSVIGGATAPAGAYDTFTFSEVLNPLNIYLHPTPSLQITYSYVLGDTTIRHARVTFASVTFTWGRGVPPLRQRQRLAGTAGSDGPPLRQLAGGTLASAAAPTLRQRQNA